MSTRAGRRQYLKRFTFTLASSEAQRVERMLAGARTFLAISSFVAIYLDPTEPSRFASLAYGLLAAYVVHSSLIWILLQIRRESTPGFRLIVHAIDVLWPALISFFTTGPNSPFFLFNVFVLLAAAYRWGFIETLGTAGAVVVLFYSQAVLMASGPGVLRGMIGGEIELNRFVMRGLYLMIMGYLLGYLGEEEKLLRAETAGIARIISRIQAETGLRGALHAVFDDLLRIFGSSRALLVLREESTGNAFRWDARREGADDDLKLELTELDTLENLQYLFDPPGEVWHAKRRDASGEGRQFELLVLDEKGARLRHASWKPSAAFLAQHEFRALLAETFSLGNEWSGTLLILDPRPGTATDVAARYLQTLTRQISPAIYSVFLTRRLRSRIGAVERARVARELHDGVIQSLIGLEMQVDVLRRQAETSSEGTAKELVRVQQILRQEVLNLRELMQQMRPLDLSPRQLLDFLAQTVDKFGHDAGVSAHFVSGLGDVSPPPRVCKEIVRIVQEALVNVRKHSGARNVLVKFDAQNGLWKLVIDDDGRGFDFIGRMNLAELDVARKGPLVIKERVRSIGGDLVVESAPGRGARLEISIPQKGHG
ncbi:MAG TPA: histidine kinase [Terriglobia bacterium]|nr:histidine kinase [Terriglobia bacterium]